MADAQQTRKEPGGVWLEFNHKFQHTTGYIATTQKNWQG